MLCDTVTLSQSVTEKDTHLPPALPHFLSPFPSLEPKWLDRAKNWPNCVNGESGFYWEDEGKYL